MQSSVDGHLVCFHVFVMVNNCCYEHWGAYTLSNERFSFSRYVLRSGSYLYLFKEPPYSLVAAPSLYPQQQ